MPQLLIKNACAITLDTQRQIIDDSAIVIEDGRFSYVGACDALATQPHYDEVIDARHMVALPGLIDCHAHAGHGLIKSLGTDEGDAWNHACELIYAQFSTLEFWHAEAALASLERLKFGVTCGVSLLGGGNDVYRSDEPDYAEHRASAIEATGIREILAVGPCAPPYPRHFNRWNGQHSQPLSVSLEQQLRTTETLIDRLHGRNNAKLQLGIVSPVVYPSVQSGKPAEQWMQQARQARELSREHKVLFTQDGHRNASIGFAHDKLDLLGPDVLFSHATDMSEREISLVAETGTHIVHNPSAIAAINGRCPVPELIDAGASVVIGSDATAPDRSADLFRHMQQCMHYHRRHFRDARILPPGKTLEMVTIDAAHALGQGDNIGSIEVGKKADLILLDLYKAHTYPLNMPLYRVVYFANGSDVDSVIIDGEILLRSGKAIHVDENQVLDDAQRETHLALERSGLTHLLEYPKNIWGKSRF